MKTKSFILMLAILFCQNNIKAQSDEVIISKSTFGIHLGLNLSHLINAEEAPAQVKTFQPGGLLGISYTYNLSDQIGIRLGSNVIHYRSRIENEKHTYSIASGTNRIVVWEREHDIKQNYIFSSSTLGAKLTFLNQHGVYVFLGGTYSFTFIENSELDEDVIEYGSYNAFTNSYVQYSNPRYETNHTNYQLNRILGYGGAYFALGADTYFFQLPVSIELGYHFKEKKGGAYRANSFLVQLIYRFE